MDVINKIESRRLACLLADRSPINGNAAGLCFCNSGQRNYWLEGN